jgi:predicted RNA binding protein YcfA (HicA-like mRNA interferase family)
MKVRDVIRRLRRDGWYPVKSKRGHRNFKHPTKRGRVTVPGHENDEVNPKTLRSIWQQAQLPEEA